MLRVYAKRAHSSERFEGRRRRRRGENVDGSGVGRKKDHGGTLRAARAQSDCYKETIIKVALIKRVAAWRRCSLDGNLSFPLVHRHAAALAFLLFCLLVNDRATWGRGRRRGEEGRASSSSFHNGASRCNKVKRTAIALSCRKVPPPPPSAARGCHRIIKQAC